MGMYGGKTPMTATGRLSGPTKPWRFFQVP